MKCVVENIGGYIYIYNCISDCMVCVIYAVRIHRKEIVRSGDRLELKLEENMRIRPGVWLGTRKRDASLVRWIVGNAPRG